MVAVAVAALTVNRAALRTRPLWPSRSGCDLPPPTFGEIPGPFENRYESSKTVISGQGKASRAS